MCCIHVHTCTYQPICHVEQEVHGSDAVCTVLPLAVHNHTWLVLKPRHVVVLPAIVHWVAGDWGRCLGRGRGVQLVAIVTNADFELNRSIHWMYSGGREEHPIHLVPAVLEEGLGGKVKEV